MAGPYTKEFKEKIKDYMVKNYADMTLEQMGHNKGVSHYTITKLRKELIREGRVPKKKPRVLHSTYKSPGRVKAKDIDLDEIREQEAIKQIKANQESLHNRKLKVGTKVKCEGCIAYIKEIYDNFYLCVREDGLNTCINRPIID
jgi:hypothetical protein